MSIKFGGRCGRLRRLPTLLFLQSYDIIKREIRKPIVVFCLTTLLSAIDGYDRE